MRHCESKLSSNSVFHISGVRHIESGPLTVALVANVWFMLRLPAFDSTVYLKPWDVVA